MAGSNNTNRGCGTLNGWGVLFSGIAALGGLLFAITQVAPGEDTSKDNSDPVVIESVSESEPETSREDSESERDDSQDSDPDEESEPNLDEEPSPEENDATVPEGPDLGAEPSEPPPIRTPATSPTPRPNPTPSPSPTPRVTPTPSLPPPPARLPEPTQPQPTAPTRSFPTIPPNLPPLDPQIVRQRVNFPTGSNSVLIANTVNPNKMMRYVLNMSQGHILTVSVKDGQSVNFDVKTPSGQIVGNASSIMSWSGVAPVGGDYTIDVKSSNASEFTLFINSCWSALAVC